MTAHSYKKFMIQPLSAFIIQVSDMETQVKTQTVAFEFSVCRWSDPHLLFKACAEIILVGVSAFHTDFFQCHICCCEITAGGIDSLGCNVIADTDSLFLS